MVTLDRRRDYYDAQNGTHTTLQQDDSGLSVPLLDVDGNPQVAQSVLESLSDAEVQAWLDQRSIDASNAIVKMSLREIDIASIRGIREWVAAQPGAPDFVVDREAEALAKRTELK